MLNRIGTFIEKNTEQLPSVPWMDSSYYHGNHDREQALRLRAKLQNNPGSKNMDSVQKLKVSSRNHVV